jgi:cytoskeletal protein RodZ
VRVELFDDQKAVEKRRDCGPVPQDVAEPKSKSLQTQSQDGQSLIQLFVMILGAIVLVILLVLFARWIYHKVHHNSEPTSVTTSQQAKENESSNSQQGANSQSSNSSNSSGSNNSGSSSSNSSGSSNNSLPNNGPGNVIAIFAGSTLAAAGLHYIISVRRFSKNGV